MAMLCPHCNLPMTASEARSGSCPVCEKPLPGLAPAVAPAPPPVPESSSSRFWAIGGGIGFLLLLVVLWVVTSDRKQPEEEQQTADLRKPEPEKKEKKSDPVDTPKPEQKEPPKKEEKEPDPVKPEVKKEEPKKEEPKKEEPKKEEPKKEEPKKPDPMPVKEPDPVPVPPVRQRLVTLPFFANDAIKIDGDLSDWKDYKPVLLTAVERGREPKPVRQRPKTQLAWFAHTQKGILIAVDVEDTSGELENAPNPPGKLWPFWDNDAIEVYIDTLNKHQGGRGEENQHQFIAFPFGTPNDGGMGGYEAKMFRSGKSVQTKLLTFPSTGPNPMLRAGKRHALGWSMECLIPRTALRGPLPKAGDVLGFEIQIDTGTNVFYFWANDDPRTHVSMTPSAWGEALLAGTDAKVEPLDATMKPGKSFAPGKPLLVRVVDADRNLDPAKKETVVVTLRSRSEDVKTLTLEETAPDSGIFVGSMTTRIATGTITPNIFEVVAGEEVAIEYVDAGRANGERDVKVRATVTAGP